MIMAACLADRESTLVIRKPGSGDHGRVVPGYPNIEIAGLPANKKDKGREEWLGLVLNALVHIGSILPPDYKVRALLCVLVIYELASVPSSWITSQPHAYRRRPALASSSTRQSSTPRLSPAT